ncbi:MAG: prolyl oligopeptidase family serine peptidase [Bryobacteraceae bacterium]
MRRLLLLLPLIGLAQAPPPNPPAYVPTEDERSQIVARTTELGKRISLLRDRHADAELADVEVYHKAIQWLLRHPEEFFSKPYVAHAMTVLERGVERAKALEQGKTPWVEERGRRVARAYRSKVDSSLQPYVVVVPPAYDGSKPIRLDVVLHGRGATLSEASFIAQAEQSKPNSLTYPDRIELHVFGRTNNAYRWAGETDVYEALTSVESRYKIDRDRTILRGFSMGGAGTWHIGLHDPSRWVAIEAGAGFTETIRYAKQTELPEWVRLPLHIYDAMDYAHNAFNVPTVGYGGDQDPQLQASVNIKNQLAAEKLQLSNVLFLVGPNSGHKFHPDSKRESDEFLDGYAAKGKRSFEKMSFVTYTTRYDNCAWVTVEGLERHYDRAQVDTDGGTVTTRNVSRIRLDRPGTLTLDGQRFAHGGTFEKRAGKWAEARSSSGLRKQHGLQGPIDDAFQDSFLCVRPGKGSSERLERFQAEFTKWMRGDVRVEDDTRVTAKQIAEHNLVLFGDPSSNALIAKIAPKLPIRLDGSDIRVGEKRFPAASHTLAMIYPNPLNPKRYVVLNTGHSFGEREFKGTNALLFPRLGDWAVLDAAGKPVAAGLFDEQWRLRP